VRKKCGVRSAECGVNGTEAPVAPVVFPLCTPHSAFRTLVLRTSYFVLSVSCFVLAAPPAAADEGKPAPADRETKILCTYPQAVYFDHRKIGYRMVTVSQFADGGHRLQVNEFLKRRTSSPQAEYSRALKADVDPRGSPLAVDCEIRSGRRKWHVKGRAEGREFILERTVDSDAQAAVTARIPLEEGTTLRCWAVLQAVLGGGAQAGSAAVQRWRVIDSSLGALLPEPFYVRTGGRIVVYPGAGQSPGGTLVAWSCGVERGAHIVDADGRVLRSVWESAPLADEMVSLAEARKPDALGSEPAWSAPTIEGLSSDAYRNSRFGYEVYVPPYPFIAHVAPTLGVVRVADATDEADVTIGPAVDPQLVLRSDLGEGELESLARLVQQQWAATYDEVQAEPAYASHVAGRKARTVEGKARLGCTTFFFRNTVVAANGFVLLVTVRAADVALSLRRDLLDPLAASLKLVAPEGRLPIEVRGSTLRVPYYGLEVRLPESPEARWMVPGRQEGPATVLELVREDHAAAAVIRVHSPARSVSAAGALADFVADLAGRVRDSFGGEKPKPEKAQLGGCEALRLFWEGDLLDGQPARCDAYYVATGERIFGVLLISKKAADGARKELEAIRLSLNFTSERAGGG